MDGYPGYVTAHNPHPEVTVDVIAGKTEQEAHAEAKLHQGCSWVAGRKYFAVRLV